MEALFAECISKNQIIKTLLHFSSPKTKLILFGGAIRDFIHYITIEKKDAKNIVTYPYPNENIDDSITRLQNVMENTVVVKDFDIMTDDTNLFDALSKPSKIEELGLVERHVESQLNYEGLQIRDTKHYRFFQYQSKTMRRDVADICVTSDINSLSTDMNINRIAFDLKEKRLFYIGGTEEQLKTAIEDVQNDRFELTTDTTKIKEMFISEGYALFRLSKMWLKGYRPKDKESFRKLYLSVLPPPDKIWLFPSSQFSKPISRAEPSIEDYLKA